MKNLSMTAIVMVKTQPTYIPQGSVQGKIYILKAVFWDVMLSSWVSSPWCFWGTGIIWNVRKYSPYDTGSHPTSMNLQKFRTTCSVKERWF